MQTQPTFHTIATKNLVGHYRTISFNDNSTYTLWNHFMPLRNEIKNAIGTTLYSVQLYPIDFFKNFSPNNPFEKWACREVPNFENVPSGMSTLVIPEGLYAVFHFIGDASNASEIYNYIFMEWLPASNYNLDIRPHFEILGELYKYNDPNSEEDIWIPIISK
ncbi:MAG: GyrI-like domain-containing protein [bacterium]|nr:GyrI-like domain-containing protein [bacterium]